MDILQLYQDFSVDHRTEGHKHCRPGWVNTECPFCQGNFGYHLGYDLQSNHYYCWRCGWHPAIPTIAKLIHLPFEETKTIVRRYGVLFSTVKETKMKIRAKAHKLPTGTGPLGTNHIKYLESRGFDPTYLTQEWGLVGTGPVSLLDGIDYKHRIIAPVIWDNTEISFISRDITNKHPLRYIVCPQDRELMLHKDVVYGKQDAWSDVGIVVEGITDVWRFGSKAVATFGIEYTHKQVRVIAKTFKKVYVCYDDDPQAVIQANKLVADLKFRGTDAKRIPIVGDPGGMKQSDADYLLKQLI